MTKKDKILILILIFMIALIGIGGYALLKDKKENTDDKGNEPSETEIIDDEEPILELADIVRRVNEINKVLISGKISEDDFIVDENTNNKYYKYTGEDEDVIVSYILLTFIKFNNDYFMLSPNEEKRKEELYIAKPANCNSIIEIEVNDITYDQYDDELGYANIYIKNEEKSFEYNGKLEKPVMGNRLRIAEPFNPCI